MRATTLWISLTVVVATAVSPAWGVDEAHYRRGREMIQKSIQWLKTQQDQATGGWSVSPGEGAPQFPAITGLVVNGMLLDPRIDARDPAVAKGVKFILSYRQPDGGIYDKVLPSYNTAICLSALARVQTAEAGAAIEPAQKFLRGLQWGEESIDDRSKDTGKVAPSHPFYGGVGYGRSGRPDASNLGMFVQAMHDSGLSCDDEAFKRAVVFLSRTQMLDSANDLAFADGSSQGGFIYSTSPDSKPENLGVGESKAGMVEESLPDGTKVSRLRAYGSMTYAGFKAYLYADLSRDDPRVKAAYAWLRRNYTVDENPGVGTDGQYYYYVTFARALDAWGLPAVATLKADGSNGPVRQWGEDLIDKLATLQNDDGSFRSVDDRWMEDNQVLITAYALLALQHAVD